MKDGLSANGLRLGVKVGLRRRVAEAQFRGNVMMPPALVSHSLPGVSSDPLPSYIVDWRPDARFAGP